MLTPLMKVTMRLPGPFRHAACFLPVVFSGEHFSAANLTVHPAVLDYRLSPSTLLDSDKDEMVQIVGTAGGGGKSKKSHDEPLMKLSPGNKQILESVFITEPTVSSTTAATSTTDPAQRVEIANVEWFYQEYLARLYQSYDRMKERFGNEGGRT